MFLTYLKWDPTKVLVTTVHKCQNHLVTEARSWIQLWKESSSWWVISARPVSPGRVTWGTEDDSKVIGGIEEAEADKLCFERVQARMGWWHLNLKEEGGGLRGGGIGECDRRASLIFCILGEDSLPVIQDLLNGEWVQSTWLYEEDTGKACHCSALQGLFHENQDTAKPWAAGTNPT